ncbi:unnamed protein product, partial [Notodromas monacha]
MTVDGALPPALGNEVVASFEEIPAEARYSVTLDGTQLTQTIESSGGGSWSTGPNVIRVYSCGHAQRIPGKGEDGLMKIPGQQISACPDCVSKSQ